MGTREDSPVTPGSRARETMWDLDFNARMAEKQGDDRLSRSIKRSAPAPMKLGAPSHIPSTADYIRQTRMKEENAADSPGIGMEVIYHPDNFTSDIPTEAQVRAFEELNRK